MSQIPVSEGNGGVLSTRQKTVVTKDFFVSFWYKIKAYISHPRVLGKHCSYVLGIVHNLTRAKLQLPIKYIYDYLHSTTHNGYISLHHPV